MKTNETATRRRAMRYYTYFDQLESTLDGQPVRVERASNAPPFACDLTEVTFADGSVLRIERDSSAVLDGILPRDADGVDGTDGWLDRACEAVEHSAAARWTYPVVRSLVDRATRKRLDVDIPTGAADEYHSGLVHVMPSDRGAIVAVRASEPTPLQRELEFSAPEQVVAEVMRAMAGDGEEDAG